MLLFYVLLTVHLGTVHVNMQIDALFNVFISLLCVFRANQCSSSGESIILFPEWYIPDNVLIQLILLMMNTGLLETC